jgi:hypothetical protein
MTPEALLSDSLDLRMQPVRLRGKLISQRGLWLKQSTRSATGTLIVCGEVPAWLKRTVPLLNEIVWRRKIAQSI